MAASAIPTIVSASFRVSSRSDSGSSSPLFSRSWCSSRRRMKSLIPTGRDYIGSGARLQEDLARHLARTLLAGAFFGEPTGPAAQEQRHCCRLLQRLVGPLYTGLSCGFDPFPSQDVVELVGKNAGPGVAHERSPDEGPVDDGRTEREEGHPEGIGNGFFQVCADDEVGLRGFDAGCDLLGIVLDESPFGEGVGVEEEVPFKVREIGSAGGDLQPDLAGQGITEAQGVSKVTEYDDLAILERLGRFQPRVPRELRRTS